jgi:hypothetical protein
MWSSDAARRSKWTSLSPLSEELSTSLKTPFLNVSLFTTFPHTLIAAFQSTSFYR